MRPIQVSLIVFIMVGTSLLVLALPAQACFSWEVTANDRQNGVEPGMHTEYTVEVHLSPGCRSTYWLSFTSEGEPPGWETKVLDETGHEIHMDGTEFVLSGNVYYYFTFWVKAPSDAGNEEEAAIVFHIRANDKYNQDEVKDVETMTIAHIGDHAPDPAGLQEAPDTGNNWVNLEWDATSTFLDFDHYEVHRSTADFIPVSSHDARTWVVDIDDRGTTEYNVTGLAEGSTYYFQIRVVDSQGEVSGGPYFADSEEVAGRTKGTNYPPTAVTVTSHWSVTNESAKINWTKNEDVDFSHYAIHASLSSGFSPQKNNERSTYYEQLVIGGQLIGIWENETIYVKVRVYDNGNPALYNDSNEISFTTLEKPPHPSILEEAMNTTYHSTRLNWTYNRNTDFNYYEVHYSTEDGFSPDETTLYKTVDDLRENSTWVEGLQDDTTYYFILRTVDNGSYFADSNQVEVTTPNLNQPPVATVIEDPAATDVDEKWIKVRWEKNEEADFDRYELYKDTQNNFDIDAGEGELVKTINSASTNYYKVTELEPGTKYYFCVRTWDEGDDNNDPLSNDSAIKMIETEPLPEAVSLNYPYEMTSSTVILDWTENEDDDFEEYEIHYSLTSGFTPSSGTRYFTDTPLDNSKILTYSIEGLEEKTTYYFVVRVYDGGSSYADSNEVDATTPNGAPEAVELQDLYSVRDDEFTAVWSASEAADFSYYEVHVSSEQDFTPDRETLQETIHVAGDAYYEVEGLEPDMEYFCVILTYDEDDEFSTSNYQSAITDKARGGGGDDDDSPGFGLLLVSLALLGSAGLVRRRE